MANSLFANVNHDLPTKGKLKMSRALMHLVLVIESRRGATGGKPPRNVDYSQAVRTHIERLKALGMVLEEVQIASLPAMKLPEASRRILPDGFSWPLVLSGTDPEELRLAIGRASAMHARTAKSGGNPTKKLRLCVQSPMAKSMRTDEIAELLAFPPDVSIPTADQQELSKRVRTAIKRERLRRLIGSKATPNGQMNVTKVPATANRFVRDPEVIAWVLLEADGHCEKCGDPAPFKRGDEEPYLEVHHVRPLGEGGPDTIDNAAACCPNCHRQLHHDPGRDLLRQTMISKIVRLKDYP